jgi:type II secretory pathway pseudopilin PulG
MRQNQHGFTLFAAILTLALVAAGLPFAFSYMQEMSDRREAEAAGAEVATINSAIRAYLSEHGARAFAAAAPLPRPDQATASFLLYRGTGWLQAAECGGAARGNKPFLGCQSAQTVNGRSVSVYIFNRTLGGTTVPHAVMVVDGFTDREGISRLDLASRAATVANGAQPVLSTTTVSGAGGVFATSASPVIGMHYGFYPYLGGPWSHPSPAPPLGALVAENSGAPELDAWLRVDGTNRMRADLNMDGNEIINLGGIRGDLNVFGDALIEGAGSARDYFIRGMDASPGTDGVPRGLYVSTGLSFPVTVTNGTQIRLPVCPTTAPVADASWSPATFLLRAVDPDTGQQLTSAADISAWTMFLEPPSAGNWVAKFFAVSKDIPGPPVEITAERGLTTGTVYVRCRGL